MHGSPTPAVQPLVDLITVPISLIEFGIKRCSATTGCREQSAPLPPTQPQRAGETARPQPGAIKARSGDRPLVRSKKSDGEANCLPPLFFFQALFQFYPTQERRLIDPWGTVGRAEVGHEWPKLHLPNLYTFCCHFYSTAVSSQHLYSDLKPLQHIFKEKNHVSPSLKLLPQITYTCVGEGCSPNLRAEHSQMLRHRLLLAKCFGIQPDGEQLCGTEFYLTAHLPRGRPQPRDQAEQLSTARSREAGLQRKLPRSGAALGTGLPAIVFIQGGCRFACQYLQRENRV